MKAIHPSSKKLHAHGIFGALLAGILCWGVVSVYYSNPLAEKPWFFIAIAVAFAAHAGAVQCLVRKKQYVLENGRIIETPWIFGKPRETSIKGAKNARIKQDLLDLACGTATVEMELKQGAKKKIQLLALADSKKIKAFVG